MKLKKIASFIIFIAVITVSLCSCKSQTFSLTINDEPIDEEIFNYFTAQAENSGEYPDDGDSEQAALELCKSYEAENQLIDKYKSTLSPEEKVMISKETKAQWQYYEGFYKKYSVSKQTLNAIIEHNFLFENTIIKMYSQDGESPVSENQIKKFYNENYISAEIISADIADDNEKDELKKIFAEMKKEISGGASPESASEMFPEKVKYHSGNSIVSVFDTAYPEDFFKNISGIKEKESGIILYSSKIYLVYICDKSVSDSRFSMYREKCLIKMQKEDAENQVKTIAQTSKIVYNKKR